VWGVSVRSGRYRHEITIQIHDQWYRLEEDVVDFRFDLAVEHRPTCDTIGTGPGLFQDQ
jgi:hypothetical protein